MNKKMMMMTYFEERSASGMNNYAEQSAGINLDLSQKNFQIASESLAEFVSSSSFVRC